MGGKDEPNEYSCADDCLRNADECIRERAISAESCRANFLHCVEACRLYDHFSEGIENTARVPVFTACSSPGTTR